MQYKKCPICGNTSEYRFTKDISKYYECVNCRSLYCGELPNDNLIGGVAELERNTQQNHLRIHRIDELCAGENKENIFILDWGAGHGYFINDLKQAGYHNTFGYDLYNEEFQTLPSRDTFHIVTSIECFEHLSAPFVEVDAIYRSMKNNGVVYIETGFLDATRDEGIKDEDNPYVNPSAGHSIIYTHHALDVLMLSKKFKIEKKFNRHCHVYSKRENK